MNNTEKAKGKIRLWLIIFTLLLSYSFTLTPVFAQDCGVAGTVTNSAGEPVPNTFVAIHYPLGILVGSAWTDSSGSYAISSLPCDVQLTEFVVCSGPFLDLGVKFGPIGSGTYTLNRTGIDCMIGPVPSPSPSPGPNLYPSLTCNPSLPGDRDSRPYYNYNCDLCNRTSLLTGSCAESFTVHDNVSFYWWEGEQCLAKPEEYWVEKSWDGIIGINPSETTIPFVGKKGNEEEKLYLADYFEGTNEYYKNYGKYWLDWVNHAGVLRKLTPMQYQDELKKQMVKRAEKTIASGGRVQEGGVHDYELKYIGRLCWDTPVLGDLLLALAQRFGVPGLEFVTERTHYCIFEGTAEGTLITPINVAIHAFNSLPLPFKISHWQTTDEEATLTQLDGHYPPDPNEENYVEKWNAWKESEWGRLWEVVPLVSREDTPGNINPYLGARPEDTFIVQNPEAQIEKVPHVARLYEASQEVQKIMTPFWQQGGTAQKETGTIIASAKENVLGEKILLAQAKTFHLEAEGIYSAPEVNVTVCFVSDTCDGDIALETNGKHTAGLNAWNLKNGPYCYGPSFTGSPFIVQPGQTINVTYTGRTWNSSCTNRSDTITCVFSVDNDGNFSTNCGALAPPPGPACGLAEALPVNSCQLPAITDSNPNDKLCCDQININLTAIDSFNITNWYKECEERQNEIPPRPCGPKTEDVSRQIGINLSHPYLYEIWNQTGESETFGIFNFFRLASVAKFSDIDAASQINYGYSGGSVEPSVGKFYFPYLGGVQLAKQWLIQALTPYKE